MIRIRTYKVSDGRTHVLELQRGRMFIFFERSVGVYGLPRQTSYAVRWWLEARS